MKRKKQGLKQKTRAPSKKVHAILAEAGDELIGFGHLNMEDAFQVEHLVDAILVGDDVKAFVANWLSDTLESLWKSIRSLGESDSDVVHGLYDTMYAVKSQGYSNSHLYFRFPSRLADRRVYSSVYGQ